MRRRTALGLGALAALLAGSMLMIVVIPLPILVVGALFENPERLTAASLSIAVFMLALLGWLASTLAARAGEAVARRCGEVLPQPEASRGWARRLLAYTIGVLVGFLVVAGVGLLAPLAKTLLGSGPWIAGVIALAGPTAGLIAARVVLRWPARPPVE